MKTIRGKILLNMIGGLTLLALIIAVTASWFGMRSTVTSIEKTLKEAAQVAASSVAANLKVYESIAYEAGCLTALANPNNSAQTKKDVLDQKIATYSFARANYVNTLGISPIDGLDVSDREYFKEALKGNTWVSEPTTSKSTGQVVIMVAAPVWQDGNPTTNTVVGVVYFTQTVEFIIELVTEMKVGDTGTTYILDKSGMTIAHPNRTIVENFENTQELVKTDKKLEKLALLEARMIAGESGFGEYSYGGVSKYLAFAPIDVPSQWSLGISVGKSEFLQSINQSVIILGVIVLVLLVVFGIVSTRVATSIASPISRIAKRIELMANGDLHTPVKIEHTKDETEVLSECAKRTVDNLNSYIVAIGSSLDAIANGDLSFEPPAVNYEGDFVRLELTVNSIFVRLNETISGMQFNAEQVSYGSNQVASGAQALSQGATEQASSIQELMSTVQEVSHQIRNNAKNAETALDETAATGTRVAASNEKMEQMINAMNDISSKSTEISKIIKTIEDIAFQTNILALNAAVEAARAGAAGRGFAVVADEVRNLAGKSAEAAKNTTELIEQTVKAVNNGTRIAGDTALALVGVVDGAKLVTSAIQEITEASAHQAEAMNQISNGMEQISAVVQTNSATAEQSAAASEQLSGQAHSLNGLVSEFKLRKKS